jgi:phosphoglycerate dehydrogenase-like enzyme
MLCSDCFSRAAIALSVAAALVSPSLKAIASEEEQLIVELGLHEAAVPLRETPSWRRPKTIVVSVDGPERLAWLREVTEGTETTIVPAASPLELRQHIGDADAMVGPCIDDVIKAGKQLRWVQVGVVSVEDCLAIPSIRDGDVILTNLQRVNGATVAEHAMGMILILSRQMVSLINDQRERKWSSRPPPNMIALEGKTMLIVGFGGVGSQIARRAHAFGMHVLATDKTVRHRPEFVDYLGPPMELGMLVVRADFIVNATPLTKDTVGLFDARMFALMRRSAFFFNVGRGGSVVTDDLVDALNAGKIAGAGLDVVEPEPLPEDHPLWRMSNVLITPHIADNSELKRERSWLVIRENLRRFVEGGKLLSVVDVNRGY